MTLVLTLVRGAEAVHSAALELADGNCSIGRAPDNDWVLPDPERHVSKRHCLILSGPDGWQVEDISTNGTFLNGDAVPIGQGQRRMLQEGDRLGIGPFEIAVHVSAPVEDPFAEAPPAFIEPRPLALPEMPSLFGKAQFDHTPAIEDAFHAPRAVAALPDDWDIEPIAPPAQTPIRATPETDSLLAIFLRGAGLPNARLGAPEEAMEALGRSFRALVSGLRQTLVARAAIKGEFRIGQTMIRSRGNNPLKFAANDDDALTALLGAGRAADMAPDVALAEALRDIRLHELASVAAMQAAARALLARLDPEPLIHDAGSLLSTPRKAHAWDAYAALHATTTKALADDFDSVFGKAFARAYEQALSELIADRAAPQNEGHTTP